MTEFKIHLLAGVAIPARLLLVEPFELLKGQGEMDTFSSSLAPLVVESAPQGSVRSAEIAFLSAVLAFPAVALPQGFDLSAAGAPESVSSYFLVTGDSTSLTIGLQPELLHTATYWLL